MRDDFRFGARRFGRGSRPSRRRGNQGTRASQVGGRSFPHARSAESGPGRDWRVQKIGETAAAGLRSGPTMDKRVVAAIEMHRALNQRQSSAAPRALPGRGSASWPPSVILSSQPSEARLEEMSVMLSSTMSDGQTRSLKSPRPRATVRAGKDELDLVGRRRCPHAMVCLPTWLASDRGGGGVVVAAERRLAAIAALRHARRKARCGKAGDTGHGSRRQATDWERTTSDPAAECTTRAPYNGSRPNACRLRLDHIGGGGRVWRTRPASPSRRRESCKADCRQGVRKATETSGSTWSLESASLRTDRYRDSSQDLARRQGPAPNVWETPRRSRMQLFSAV